MCGISCGKHILVDRDMPLELCGTNWPRWFISVEKLYDIILLWKWRVSIYDQKRTKMVFLYIIKYSFDVICLW